MRLIEQSSASVDRSQAETRMEHSSHTICAVPLGLPWFEAIPINHRDCRRHLTLVLYHDYATMMSHHQQGQATGRWQTNWALLHADLPPHAIKHLWDAVYDHQYHIVVMTLSRFLASLTVNQHLYAEQLDHIIVAQAQQLSQNIFESLIQRPKLTLLVNQFNSDMQQGFETLFQHSFTPIVLVPSNTAQQILDVARCLTQYQKLKALYRLLNYAAPENIILVVCDTQQQMNQVQTQLMKRSLSQTLVNTEDMIGLSQNSVLLCQTRPLEALPFAQWATRQIDIVYWTCPGEAQILLAAIATHPTVQQVQTLILYTKEDYVEKRQRLANQFGNNPSQKAQALDALTRIRKLCAQKHLCYRVSLQTMSTTDNLDLNSRACGVCQPCRFPLRKSVYSQWLNLIDRVLF